MTPDVPVYLLQPVNARMRRRFSVSSPYDEALALAA